MNNVVFLIEKNSNKDQRLKSQSVCMFLAISDYFLSNNGVVYGCEMNEKYEVFHSRATNKEERNKMLLSKYTQSNLKDVFVNIKNDLQDNKKVLFTGTPCQAIGLKNYLSISKTNTDNLLIVDIVCHGVPSQGVWRDFIEYLNKKTNNNVSNIIFRNKKYGWKSSKLTYEINNKEYVDNSYSTLFYKHYTIRPSCFNCPFRSTDRIGDITIGDAWGNQKKYSNFFDNSGISLLLISTEKGSNIFNKIKDNIEYMEVDKEDFLQQALKSNYSAPKKYNKFWNAYNKKDFAYIAKKYGGNNFFAKLKKKLKKIIKK